jgi:hypothetical protein
MRKVILTDTDNETVEINQDQKELFLHIVNTNDNISRCEIFCEKTGWYLLETALEEREGMSIEKIEEEHGLDEVLESFFESNLFPALV